MRTKKKRKEKKRARLKTAPFFVAKRLKKIAPRQAFEACLRRNVGTSRSSVRTSGATSRTFSRTCCTTFGEAETEAAAAATVSSLPAFHVFGRNCGFW